MQKKGIISGWNEAASCFLQKFAQTRECKAQFHLNKALRFSGYFFDHDCSTFFVILKYLWMLSGGIQKKRLNEFSSKV